MTWGGGPIVAYAGAVSQTARCALVLTMLLIRGSATTRRVVTLVSPSATPLLASGRVDVVQESRDDRTRHFLVPKRLQVPVVP